jgi:hypothetical protein
VNGRDLSRVLGNVIPWVARPTEVKDRPTLSNVRLVATGDELIVTATGPAGTGQDRTEYTGPAFEAYVPQGGDHSWALLTAARQTDRADVDATFEFETRPSEKEGEPDNRYLVLKQEGKDDVSALAHEGIDFTDVDQNLQMPPEGKGAPKAITLGPKVLWRLTVLQHPTPVKEVDIAFRGPHEAIVSAGSFVGIINLDYREPVPQPRQPQQAQAESESTTPEEAQADVAETMAS